MNRITPLLIACWFLASAAFLGGCATRQVNIDNPIPIARTEYDRVFEASVRVLRDYHFVVERQDRRFGVITTRPRAAASAIEPWYTDNTTAYQTLDNTLNYDRRIVHIYLEKQNPASPATTPTDTQAAPAPGISGPGISGPGIPTNTGLDVDYQLRVEVLLERHQIPPTNLHTAAVSSVTNYGYQGNPRTVRTEQGYESATWRPLGHDELFEQRLVAQILAVAGRIQPLHDTNPANAGSTPPASSSPVERVEPGEVPAPPSN